MKRCKQFFDKSLMLYDSDVINNYPDEFVDEFGFVLVLYSAKNIRRQLIWRVTLSKEDAIKWVQSSDDDFVRVAVACVNL